MSEERKIEISKSALISLKAELLRKQEEVSDAKKNLKSHIDNFKPTVKFPKQEEKTLNEKKSKEFSEQPEDVEALRKSKQMLEKKTIIYEHLAQSSSVSEKSEHYLVQFDKKEKEESKNDDSDEDLKKYDDDSDEEWVDYVDCLGRTRRCHKTELEDFKKQDERLKSSLNIAKPNENVPSKPWVKEGELESEEKELQPPDAYKEQLRQQWEQKEQELLTKDRVHYEDVLFNEARSHGVGYYSLSGDSAERVKQQAELAALRNQTQKAQEKVLDARAKREEALQARVKAARARQRARAGLPPEEEPPVSVTDKLLDFVEEMKKVSAESAAEEARKKREEREEIAKKEREAFVREWDLGKEELQAKMPFAQMTQEEWVEKKRKERIEDFAPPETLWAKSRGKNSREFDDKGYFVDTQGTYNVDEPSSSRLSNRYYDDSINKNRPNQEPTPIEDECEDNSSTVDQKRKSYKSRIKGAEIAPPSTFDYYGPSDKKFRADDATRANVSEAFAQGLKYLEDKQNKKPK